MRIAFVGKGGSGKTTLATLFALYEATQKPAVLIDADINMHSVQLLNLALPEDQHLSYPANEKRIKEYLIGDNKRIASTGHFKKTTPPAEGSNLIRFSSPDGMGILKRYAAHRDNLTALTLGTYTSEGIGASCYHNNLAVVENILSHTVNDGTTIIVDMVAGTDAFSNSLHAQFDALVFVVEPTKRSISILEQYHKLAVAAGVGDSMLVVANKVIDEEDEEFIKAHLPDVAYVGALHVSRHLTKVDQGRAQLNVAELEEENRTVLEQIAQQLPRMKVTSQERLRRLHQLHKVYSDQEYIKARVGDLTSQIQPDFTYEQHA